MQKHYFHLALFILAGLLALSACSSATQAPTATPVDIGAIQTAAVQAFIDQLTQQAPTIAPTPVFTNTPKVTATPTRQQPTNTLVQPTAATCSKFQLVSETIPDGTVLALNQAFVKTWKVKNTGTCSWTTSYRLVFSYPVGGTMGGTTIPMPTTVAVGDTVDLTLNLKVPNKTGNLTSVWALEDDKSQPFGLLTVVITVASASPTPTGSLTATFTVTPAASATYTPETTAATTP